jgi:hypothetical protein
MNYEYENYTVLSFEDKELKFLLVLEKKSITYISIYQYIYYLPIFLSIYYAYIYLSIYILSISAYEGNYLELSLKNGELKRDLVLIVEKTHLSFFYPSIYYLTIYLSTMKYIHTYINLIIYQSIYFSL